MKRNSLFYVTGADYKGLTESDKAEVKKGFYDDNIVKLGISAAFLAVFQILFIIRDFASGFFEENNWNYLNLVIEIIVSVVSVIMFSYVMFVRHKHRSTYSDTVFYLVFVIVIIVAVFGYMFTDMYVREAPIGVCLGFLFIIIISPFYNIFAQLLAFGITILYTFVLYVNCIDDGVLGSFGVISLLLLMFITSNFLRVNFIKVLIYKTKTAKLNDDLTHANNTDFLTGVANRVSLYNDFKIAAHIGRKMGVLIYDIDDFKKYNDAFSHLEGDECLKVTAQTVNEFAVKNGGKLYRYGGEEFVVIIYDMTADQFTELLPRFCDIVYGLRLVHSENARYPYVSISLGATYCDGSKQSFEDILKKCDAALYRAKGTGKNKSEMY